MSARRAGWPSIRKASRGECHVSMASPADNGSRRNLTASKKSSERRHFLQSLLNILRKRPELPIFLQNRLQGGGCGFDLQV